MLDSVRKRSFLGLAAILAARCAVGADGWTLPLFTSDPKAVLEESVKIPPPAGASALVLDVTLISRIDSDEIGRAHV